MSTYKIIVQKLHSEGTGYDTTVEWRDDDMYYTHAPDVETALSNAASKDAFLTITASGIPLRQQSEPIAPATTPDKHTIRLHHNTGEGTTWWADDDNGFCGGYDNLGELIKAAREYAEWEDMGDCSFVFVED